MGFLEDDKMVGSFTDPGFGCLGSGFACASPPPHAVVGVARAAAAIAPPPKNLRRFTPGQEFSDGFESVWVFCSDVITYFLCCFFDM